MKPNNFLLLSLALNLGLGAVAIYIYRAAVPPSSLSTSEEIKPSVQVFRQRARQLRRGPLSGDAVAPALSDAALADRPKDWSEIESSDYATFIANLRAAGCPEETIRDLVTARVNQAYGSQLRELRGWNPNRYWEMGRSRYMDKDYAERQRKIRALEK